MDTPKKKTRPRLVTALMDTFGLTVGVASAVAGLIVAVGLLGVFWFVRSAPPRTVVMTAGPEGSTFQRFAQRYADALKVHGVTLKILPSQGSLDNLHRLETGAEEVDIGFVQGGLAGGENPTALEHVVSLGSVSYQPLMIFYRSQTKLARLSELAGKRIAVGAEGSGTRALALALLDANGVKADNAALDSADAGAAATALMDGKLDAVFLMGDSAPLPTLRTLLRADGIRLYDFGQADAYTRRFSYLNRLVLPQGVIDLGKNLPAENVALVGPTVELVARKGLHPALSDLLLEVAQEVHGGPGLLQKRGEFPAPLEQQIKISDDAKRFYKSGKGLLYSNVRSFWLASLLYRTLVVFVPILLVLIPTLRVLPIVYRLRNQLRIYRCYRPLLLLERDAAGPLTPERRQELLQRLDDIEHIVRRVRVPASFGEQFYALRQHIVFVRERLTNAPNGAPAIVAAPGPR